MVRGSLFGSAALVAFLLGSVLFGVVGCHGSEPAPVTYDAHVNDDMIKQIQANPNMPEKVKADAIARLKTPPVAGSAVASH